jgi:hypothetical protein
VMYTISKSDPVKKDLVYTNSEFDLVPLKYHSNYEDDMVFYLNSGRYEKFAFLKLK